MSMPDSRKKKKVIVVLPAYNAERTLERTIQDIPRDLVDDLILVDDCSQDHTFTLATQLGIEAIRHSRNRGYGGNQKTCYTQALHRGADIVVMVHPDYQYDPTQIPQLLGPLLREECDAVFGSRMLGKKFFEGGMPHWKFYGNVMLTALENMAFRVFFTEYHSGFRAYSRKYLETVNFLANSDDFVFDTEMIAQGVFHGLRIYEVPIATRYFQEASQIGWLKSVRYAISIVVVLIKFRLQEAGWKHFEIFTKPAKAELPWGSSVTSDFPGP